MNWKKINYLFSVPKVNGQFPIINSHITNLKVYGWLAFKKNKKTKHFMQHHETLWIFQTSCFIICRGWIASRHIAGAKCKVSKLTLFCRMWLIDYNIASADRNVWDKVRSQDIRKQAVVVIHSPQDSTQIYTGLKLACVWHTCTFNDIVYFCQW